MQSHTNTSRVGRRCRLLAVAALTLTLFSGVCVKNTAMASADGPDVISGASGLLSQTSYRSVPVGVDSYDYWTEQATAPDRVQYVADPAGKRGTVQRIEVQPGDRSGEGERAEVLNLSDLGGFQDGETIVMSWGVMIDSTFASPLGTWNSFVQIHADGGGNQSPLYLSLSPATKPSCFYICSVGETGLQKDNRTAVSRRASTSALCPRIDGMTSSCLFGSVAQDRVTSSSGLMDTFWWMHVIERSDTAATGECIGSRASTVRHMTKPPCFGSATPR